MPADDPVAGSSWLTLRARLADASVPFLQAVARAPRFVVTGLFTVLVLLGLFAPRWVATASLAVLVVVLGWLLVLMGRDGGSTRTGLRIGSFVLLAVVLVVRAAGLALPR